MELTATSLPERLPAAMLCNSPSILRSHPTIHSPALIHLRQRLRMHFPMNEGIKIELPPATAIRKQIIGSITQLFHFKDSTRSQRKHKI